MPLSSQLEDVPKEDGSTAKKLHVEFTNGSLEQLESLAEYYNVNGDPAEVVKLGISFLQNIMDKNSTKKDDSQS